MKSGIVRLDARDRGGRERGAPGSAGESVKTAASSHLAVSHTVRALNPL